jgi:SAM-dependent methyltransferase
MTDWTSGYVADIGYTYGYYAELNPLRARFALLNKGLVCPEFKTACELGFGQGLSTVMHAATTGTQWYGTDFNPSQAAYGQELAASCGANAKLFDEAFADFAARTDLPEFDFIGLHGIWSWISDENRKVIVEFIRKKLAVGGVLYISYNTQPGWASFAPMRHLMTEHAEIIGAEGRGIINRVDDAIEFASKLLATNPVFARANPLVADRIAKLKTQNRHYLAHEYFNRDWHPMHFSTMADWLEPAKVQFACSAAFHESIDTLNLSKDQQTFLNEIPDLMFKESVRDFMVNQQFRRDYWVKGARKLSLLEQAEQLLKEKVILTTMRADVAMKVTGALGEAEMSPNIYNPILDALADHKVKTIGQLELAMKGLGIPLPQILSAMQILIGNGAVQLVQDEAITHKARKTSEKLNAHLKNKARGNVETTYMASPVLGGGFTVNRFQQLFMLAMDSGLKQPDAWADYAWQLLNSLGQRIIKDGKTLETPAENVAEMQEQARLFAEKMLPIAKSLQLL